MDAFYYFIIFEMYLQFSFYSTIHASHKRLFTTRNNSRQLRDLKGVSLFFYSIETHILLKIGNVLFYFIPILDHNSKYQVFTYNMSTITLKSGIYISYILFSSVHYIKKFMKHIHINKKNTFFCFNRKQCFFFI